MNTVHASAGLSHSRSHTASSGSAIFSGFQDVATENTYNVLNKDFHRCLNLPLVEQYFSFSGAQPAATKIPYNVLNIFFHRRGEDALRRRARGMAESLEVEKAAL
jgi:hypothetical protein